MTDYQREAMQHEIENLKYQIKNARLENGQALQAILLGDTLGCRKHTQRAQDFLNGKVIK